MTAKEKQVLGDLWAKVDSEGFGYYMLHYGPDLNLIASLGFNKEEVEKAIKLFKAIEQKIDTCEQYAGEEGED